MTAIAVNDTPKQTVTSANLPVAPRRHSRLNSSASDPRPAMLDQPLSPHNPIHYRQVPADCREYSSGAGSGRVAGDDVYAATASATALYYTRYLTQADGEEPGVWIGRQAAGLGLAGEVTTEALQALLEGHDPITGSTLGNPLLDRVTSRGRSCGRWRGLMRRSRHRSRCRCGGRCPAMRAWRSVMTSRSGRWWAVSRSTGRPPVSVPTAPPAPRVAGLDRGGVPPDDEPPR